jgi:hypothetical protein
MNRMPQYDNAIIDIQVRLKGFAFSSFKTRFPGTPIGIYSDSRQ